MKNLIIKILNFFLGKKKFNELKNFLNKRILNYYYRKSFLTDYKLFKRDATMIKKDNFRKIETHIILNYHSLEKGLLYENMRLGFGRVKVIELIEYLSLHEVKMHMNESQIKATCLVLKKYYEIHLENNFDISEFFSKEDYEYFKKHSIENLNPVIEKSKELFFKKNSDNFHDFSFSRNSVRHYSGELVPLKTMENVISLARNAPSVCNRQGSRVYLVQDKDKVEKLLQIQGGLQGFTKNINQVLAVTGDRNGYYAIGERNQLFVDGGLFIMNLLYALHFYKVAACPAHWCYENSVDDKVRDMLGMKDSEKIISLITIGVPTDKFKVTLSLRRNVSEILKVI
jgi:nitroreductase